MPSLNNQIRATGTHQGKPVNIPPKIALMRIGPVIQVTIGLLQSMANQILQQGGQVQSPISGLALIDTGASSSCIDNGVAQSLSLPVIGIGNMSSASHAATQQNLYPVSMAITGIPVKIDSPQAMGAQLSNLGIVAIIGRDALKDCILIYNGPLGQITLAV